MWVAIITLLLVFLLIAVRQIGSFRMQIWQIMLGGAIVVLLFGESTPVQAFHAIHFDVILFLACMFLIGRALEESGYLEYLSYKMLGKVKRVDWLLLAVIFGAGIASMLLMNDTLAIIGTPFVLLLSQKHKINAKVLLLALCFAVTIGSVASPIGNPQNLLIALTMQQPFVEFLKYLFIPTIICLFLCYLVLRIFYRSAFHTTKLVHKKNPIKDESLATLCKISLMILLAGIGWKLIAGIFLPRYDISLVILAVASMLPILLHKNRVMLAKTIDWSTLVFFVAMFVLMDAVWQTGVFQSFLTTLSLPITSLPVIFSVGIVVSQFISNVPLVALYLPLLQQAGVGAKELVTLAASSTIAGSLLILGAASNVIIIQNAERKGHTLTFVEFAMVGIPLTILCVLVYWLFLQF